MLRNLLLLFMVTLTTVSQAGMLIDSEAYIKIQNGYTLFDDGGRMLVAADGGVMRFNKNDLSSLSPEFIGVDDGLPGVKVAGACRDSRGNYWFGTADGGLTVHDQDLEKIAAFHDVVTTNSTVLVALTASNNYIYLVTDKVLVRYVYNSSTGLYQVKDSNLNAGTIKCFGISGGNLYLYSDKLRFIAENSSNISDIALWSENSLPVSAGINQLKQVGDAFYALAADGYYKLDNASITKMPLLDGQNILDATYESALAAQQGYTFLVKNSDNSRTLFYQQTGAPMIQIFTDWDNAFNRFSRANNQIYCLSGNGYKVWNLSEQKFYVPTINQPLFRNVLNAAVTGDKVVYGSNNLYAAGDYRKRVWSPALTAVNNGSAHTRFLNVDNSRVLAGTWGSGILILDLIKNFSGSDSVKLHDKVSFQSAVAGGDYPVSYACGKDSKGGYWFGSFYASSNVAIDTSTTPALVKLASLNQSGEDIALNSNKYYLNQIDFRRSSCMTIDNQSRIWLGVKQEGTGLAVVAINSNNQPAFEKARNVNYAIYSLAVDQNNVLWIGTNTGAKYIDLDKITEVSDLATVNIESAPFTTAGQEVNNIYISENNEKWFATSGGVTILKNNDRDVYHLIQNYTEPDQGLGGTIEQIPMLGKGVINILDLPSTRQKLLVYQDGFMIYDFAKGSVRNEISEAVTLPAPFVADGSAEVTFYIPDNGINYRYLKIFDLKGRLVRKIQAEFSDGRRVVWNGRDDNNDIVSSGIYQYIVYSEENGQEFLRGKMAIVRK